MTWTDFVVRGTLVLAAAFAASFAVRARVGGVTPLRLDGGVCGASGAAGGDARGAEDRDCRVAAATVRTASVGGVCAGETTLRAPAGYADSGFAEAARCRSRLGAGSSRTSPDCCWWRRRFLAGAVRTSRMVRQARRRAVRPGPADAVRANSAIGRPVRALESAERAGADDVGHAAAGGAAARGGAPLAGGTTARRGAARIGPRAAPRSAGAGGRAGRLLSLLVPSAGVAGRAATPQGARARLRRCGAQRRRGGARLCRTPDGTGARHGAAAQPGRCPGDGREPATSKSASARCSIAGAIARRSTGALAATVAMLACALVLPVALVTLHAQAGTRRARREWCRISARRAFRAAR